MFRVKNYRKTTRIRIIDLGEPGSLVGTLDERVTNVWS